jgi:hypothetical protein
MACAGKLGNCPEGLDRFRSTCLKCRWRWMYYNGWRMPSFWIDYTIPWSVKYNYWQLKNGKLLLHAKSRPLKKMRENVFYEGKRWSTLKIDPRGRFLALRCAVIITFIKLAGKFSDTNPARKKLASLAEFVGVITV